MQLPDAGKACPDGIDAERHELLKESAAIQQAADRKTSNDRDSAGECGAQSEPPVVQPDPKQCRDRSGNQAMFIKSSKYHEQNCGLDRAIMRLEVQGPDQSRSHDRQCRQVGIIHPDIIVEETKHGGKEPKRSHRCREPRSGKQPHAGGDTQGCDCYRDEGEKTAQINRLTIGERREHANEIKRERRIVVGAERSG